MSSAGDKPKLANLNKKQKNDVVRLMISKSHSFKIGQYNDTRTDKQIKKILPKIQETFADGKYDECIKIINNIANNSNFQDNGVPDLLNLILGNCYMMKAEQQKQYQEFNSALLHFNKIGQTSRYYEYARYGCLLSNIRLGKDFENIKLLNDMKQTNYQLYLKINRQIDSLFNSLH
jgi:hypothetical protein